MRKERSFTEDAWRILGYSTKGRKKMDRLITEMEQLGITKRKERLIYAEAYLNGAEQEGGPEMYGEDVTYSREEVLELLKYILS